MLGCQACQEPLALKVQKALKEIEVNQTNGKCCCPHKMPQNYLKSRIFQSKRRLLLGIEPWRGLAGISAGTGTQVVAVFVQVE